VLTDSLFQAAEVAIEKECEATEVEVNGWCRRWDELRMIGVFWLVSC